MLMFNNLIDGEWLSDGARAPNVNPSDTKDIVGQAVRGTRAQAEAAIAAAKTAFRPGRGQRRKRATTS
jgi:aldehyde dehydrogenase (NAD+)